MKWFVLITLTILLIGATACQSTALLIVSGTVTDSDGISPNAAFVVLFSTYDYGIVSSPTAIDEAGYYRLSEVPGGTVLNLNYELARAGCYPGL